MQPKFDLELVAVLILGWVIKAASVLPRAITQTITEVVGKSLPCNACASYKACIHAHVLAAMCELGVLAEALDIESFVDRLVVAAETWSKEAERVGNYDIFAPLREEHTRAERERWVEERGNRVVELLGPYAEMGAEEWLAAIEELVGSAVPVDESIDLPPYLIKRAMSDAGSTPN